MRKIIFMLLLTDMDWFQISPIKDEENSELFKDVVNLYSNGPTFFDTVHGSEQVGIANEKTTQVNHDAIAQYDTAYKDATITITASDIDSAKVIQRKLISYVSVQEKLNLR